MQQSANASWDTDQNWEADSAWDFARDSATTAKGFRKGIEEVIQVIIKVIKAVATTTLLPLILLMVGALFVIITVLFAVSDSGSSRTKSLSSIEDPIDRQMVTEYCILMDYFHDQEIPVMAIMCSLYREGGFLGNNLENSANTYWGVSDEEYTAQLNSGTLSEYEFANHYYQGRHYMYWSDKDGMMKNGSCGYGIAGFTSMKQALYEYAKAWFSDTGQGAGQPFDISDVTMQTRFMLEQIETDAFYDGLVDKLLASRSIEEASIWWVKMYERPASNWEESGRSRAQDADWIKEKCEGYLAEGYGLTDEEGSSQTEGIFLWPCPSSHHITSYFGNRTPPKEGASANHKGIDIGASEGVAVIAAAAGKVTTVSYNSARGYYIVVDHGSGYETLYQHLSRQDVRVGEVVKAGQQIGAVGETGISTAPHLHFEVHVNGTPVDPLQFFE